ncbi:MAG: PAS domain S-box protein [Bryobacteraceae bacterium]|jgi:PAS domain S-box-containing protein
MRSGSPPRAPYQLLALFVVLASAIGATAYWFHLEQKATVEQDIRNQLLTVADIKVRDLSMWWSTRLGEARAILADRMELTVIRRVLAGNASASERAAVYTWMDALSRHLQYMSVQLLDRHGRLVHLVGQRLGSDEHLRQIAGDTLPEADVLVRDFHRDAPSGPVHLGLNLPLRLAPGSAAFGVLALGIDPATYLYPLLEAWPSHSASGETVLVRRVVGNEAVYLNRIPGRENSPNNLRIPMSRTDIAAVQALNGKEGNIEALDYRGVPVFAAARRVPDTPWYLVAKMDQKQVQAPIRRRSLMLGLGAVSLILVVGAMIVLWWRRQQVQFYRERYEAEIERRATEERAAQALQESESRFRAIFENAAIGMADSSLDARFIRLNQRFCEIMGYSREELLGLTFRQITHPDDLARDEQLVAQLMSGDLSSAAVEKRYLRKDGAVVRANLLLSLLRSPSGDPLHFVAVVEDVTGQKRAEDERRQLERQLLQAQKMESVGRLAGGVAHDFNNHLTVINGYCAMLLDEMRPDDLLREPVGEILLAGNRAAALTQRLLAFSRKQVAEPRVISLNDVVAEAGKMLFRLIGDDIEIVTHFDAGLGSVVADPSQMSQVLMNLAINARDAMPDGGRIIIETSNTDLDQGYAAQHAGVEPGPYVLLSITDTGVGMTQEVLQQIFDPFFTTKGVGVGTGLGLSTVYGIVKQAGGWIWVYSEPGQGSTFKVYLPRAGGAPETLRAPVAAAEALRGTETVLVVEDQPEVRRLTLAMLESRGYRLLEAANGSEALSLCEHYPEAIHLLITDVVMPGMTGRELAMRLVALRPSLKTLYTSGYTADAIVHEGVLEPGVAYLPKPFSPAQLAAKVRDVLSSKCSLPSAGTT